MRAIRRERTYPHPPDRVWWALTDPGAISEWFMQTTDFRAEDGATFVLRDDDAKGWSGVLDFGWRSLLKSGLPKVLEGGFEPDVVLIERTGAQ